MAKQSKGKIIVDFIKKMNHNSFFELFRWNTKTLFTRAIAHTEMLIYNVTMQQINVILSTLQTLFSSPGANSFNSLMTST